MELEGGAWDYDSDRAYRMSERHHMIPALIRATVATARPPWGLPYIGTWYVEHLIMDFEHQGTPDRTIELLLAARLTPDQLIAVLSGVYPDMLDEIGAFERLAGILSDERRAWLVDRTRHIGLPTP